MIQGKGRRWFIELRKTSPTLRQTRKRKIGMERAKLGLKNQLPKSTADDSQYSTPVGGVRFKSIDLRTQTETANEKKSHNLSPSLSQNTIEIQDHDIFLFSPASWKQFLKNK